MGRACESYDGIAFKYLDWSNLSDEAKTFGESHLVVLSALYGIVEPNMGCATIDSIWSIRWAINLYDTWREAVMHTFTRKIGS